jgi:thiol:disulfide interchange protein
VHHDRAAADARNMVEGSDDSANIYRALEPQKARNHRTMRRFAAVLALIALRAGDCRLTANRGAGAVWHHDLASGLKASAAAAKPAVIFFGASWDVSSVEMKRATLADPEVGALLAERFVPVDVDCTDTDSPAMVEAEERFGVRGVPALLVVAPGATAELRRFTGFVRPRELAADLRSLR